MSEFTAHYAQLSNEELVRIAHFEKRKYKKEARESARIELEHRELSDDQLQSLKKEVKTLRRIERNQKLKNKEYGILDFFLDIIFYW